MAQEWHKNGTSCVFAKSFMKGFPFMSAFFSLEQLIGTTHWNNLLEQSGGLHLLLSQH
jgi:hypothetical protein